MSVSGMNTALMPRADSRIAGSTFTAYEPSTGSCVSSTSPAAARRKPTAATGRTPIRGANWDAREAEIMIPAVNGRNARPASSGP
jgi:hypothetical protein